MKVEVEKCTINDGELSVLLRMAGRVEDLSKQLNRAGYERNSVENTVRDIVATKIAEHYLDEHRMELISSIKKEDILNGIQLKIIEGFSIGNQPHKI